MSRIQAEYREQSLPPNSRRTFADRLASTNWYVLTAAELDSYIILRLLRDAPNSGRIQGAESSAEFSPNIRRSFAV